MATQAENAAESHRESDRCKARPMPCPDRMGSTGLWLIDAPAVAGPDVRNAERRLEEMLEGVGMVLEHEEHAEQAA